MDDAEVHPGYSAGIEMMLLDGDGGGHRQPQPPTIGQQCDCADLLGRVRQGAASRTHSAGWALATGSRIRRPWIVKVPW